MEKIAILDCGGQFTKVIDRKVRELEVKSDIFPVTIEANELKAYSGIIISGGPEQLQNEEPPQPDNNIFELGIPILGIAYGMHLINNFYNGQISSLKNTEQGDIKIKIDNTVPLFDGLDNEQLVLMSSVNNIETLGNGFKAIAWTKNQAPAAIFNADLNFYGVQFYPEVDLTTNGKIILNNFLRKVCHCTEEYSLEDRIETAIKQVQDTVGNDKVIVLVSGGVDSAVTAAILLKALPHENIYAIHVDHGLMRKNESDLICQDLEKQGLVNLVRVNARDAFFHEPLIDENGKEFGALDKLADPEDKRNFIGQAFIRAVKEGIKDYGFDFDDAYLAQGTLRPDLIESGNPDVSSYAKTIKTHHNDVEIIRKARDEGKVIETNKDWHKDEVRQVARLLGLSEKIASRQPFPGPGIGVRIMCLEEPETAPKHVQEHVEALANERGFKGWVLPLRSVGVESDDRTFGLVAAIKKSHDNTNWDEIHDLTQQITNNIKEVTRVVYILGNAEQDDPDYNLDIDNISLAKTHSMFIDEENSEILREIDNTVTSALEDKPISQTFAIILPLGVNKPYSITIRTFVSSDFMTGRPAWLDSEISFSEINDLAAKILKQHDNIEFVFYDVTSKPPATCEWQ